MTTSIYEDLPLFNTSIKVMKYWALLVDYNWKWYLAVISSLLLNIGQFTDIFFTNEPIDSVIRDAYFLVLWFNALIRQMVLALRRPRYELVLKEVSIAYNNIEQNEGREVKKVLDEMTKSARRFAHSNFLLGILDSLGFVMYPLFTSIRALPYGAFIPGVDKYSTPCYEILYTFQFLVTIPGCCLYIPFTNLIVAFILFGILMNKVLHSHLAKLNDMKPENVWLEVIWCIRYQLQIIRYIEMVNSLTTYIYLVEFLSFGTLLCALLFLLNIVSSLGQVVIVAGYIIMIMAQISAMYWYANELYYQSTQVALEAYSTNWFDFDLKTQKAMLMIITRAQQPSGILVGNVYPMNLEMFQSLLNTTYSYFTLLRRVYE